ncbi:hypothetical protein VDGD_07348 [Verticillium dahliae]|nr:hypothetical protein VDGD_07348 [Verticillium dahliae]
MVTMERYKAEQGDCPSNSLTTPPRHNGSISPHLWRTGKQGGAVINTLVADNADFDILAVTRNPSSASAQRLTSKSSRIKLVEGDLADPSLVLKTAQAISGAPIWGVFSVQVGIGAGAGDEQRQGQGLVDASLAAGVSFFVYTSVDRHGDRSATNPTDVPHFIHKHAIEKHLMARAAGTPMAWTILRPVAFMENLTDDFFGRVFPPAWRRGAGGARLQLVAVSDIGVFAARAFAQPEAWAGRAVSLAGANPTLDEFAAIFKRSTGRDLPYANGILVSIILWLMKDFGSMFRWFADEGYDADIEALRKIHPGLKDVQTWLETESDFKKAE